MEVYSVLRTRRGGSRRLRRVCSFARGPAAKLCVQKALAFLPKLKEGIRKHKRAEEEEEAPTEDDLDDLFD